MSTQGHGMIKEPDTVETRYLPKCLSGDNHQGNCHNYVFDYVYAWTSLYMDGTAVKFFLVICTHEAGT